MVRPSVGPAAATDDATHQWSNPVFMSGYAFDVLDRTGSRFEDGTFLTAETVGRSG